MQTLLPYLNRALRNYFNQQPAYVLREDGSQGEAMAKKLAKGIEVKLCEIVIPFTDYRRGRIRALYFSCKGKRFRLSFVSGKNIPSAGA